MSTNANIKVNIDTKNSSKQLKGLTNDVNGTAEGVKNIRQRLMDMQLQMAEIGDVGSPEFQKLAAEAGALRDQMNNANASIKMMSDDFPKLAMGKEAMMGVGGATQIATGAMSAFGLESKSATKAIQFMMGVQSMMNGVNAVAKLFSDESITGTKFRVALAKLESKEKVKLTATQVAHNVSMKASAMTTNLAGKATKTFAGGLNKLKAVIMANPLMLLATVLIGIYQAFQAFTDSTEEQEKASESLNKRLEEQNNLFQRNQDLNERVAAASVRMAKLQGKNADEVRAAEEALLQLKEDNRKNSIIDLQEDYEAQADLRRQAYDDENWELAGQINNEMTAIKEKQNTLYSQKDIFGQSMLELSQKYANKEKQLIDDLADMGLNDLDKKLDDNNEYFDKLKLEAGNNATVLASVEQRRGEAERKIRKDHQEKLDKAAEEARKTKIKAEKELRDLNTQLISDDATRKLSMFVNKQEDELDAVIEKYGKESQIVKDFQAKQLVDLGEFQQKQIDDEEKKEKEKWSNKDALEKAYMDTLKTNLQLQLEEINQRYDAEIEKAKEAGKSTELLEKAKTKAVEDATRETTNNIKEMGLETELFEIKTARNEELRLATTEEAKEKIREKYRDKRLQAEINLLEQQRENELSNTELTQQQRANINAKYDHEISKAKKDAADEGVDFMGNDVPETIEKIGMVVDAVVAQGMTITSTLQSINDKTLNDNLEANQTALDSDTIRLKEQLANREISQAEFDDKLRKSQEEKKIKDESDRKKAFKESQKLQIANATMTGAQAVMGAISTGMSHGGPLLAAIYSAIAVASTGVQLNHIKSTKFKAAKGGVVPGSGPSNVDSVDALLAPGEAVINSRSSQAYMPLLSAINQAGGGKALMPNIPEVNTTPSIKVYNDNSAVRAYVVEQDISDSQSQAMNYKQRSKLF